MPFDNGTYISEIPQAAFSDRLSLTELEALIPGIKQRVFALIHFEDFSDFAGEQTRLIGDLGRQGFFPKDVYISQEDKVGDSVAKRLSSEIDLETFMMATGLEIVANPASKKSTGKVDKWGNVYTGKRRNRTRNTKGFQF